MLENHMVTDEAARVERFLTAFNTIEHELRRRMQLEEYVGFREASRLFSRTHRWWNVHEPVMDTAAQIRNFLVHSRKGQQFVAAVPHEDTVVRVERIAGMLTEPKPVIPLYQTAVRTFRPEQSLTELLHSVESEGFTFFPIIGNEGFQGLVTGTGLMHWLARLAADDPLTDLSEIPVVKVLEQEEPRINFAFVSRTTPVYEALDLFGQTVGLEAVLITENGRATEGLLGIITVWDVANAELD